MVVIEEDESKKKKKRKTTFSRTLTNSLQNFRMDVEELNKLGQKINSEIREMLNEGGFESEIIFLALHSLTVNFNISMKYLS